MSNKYLVSQSTKKLMTIITNHIATMTTAYH